MVLLRMLSPRAMGDVLTDVFLLKFRFENKNCNRTTGDTVLIRQTHRLIDDQSK